MKNWQRAKFAGANLKGCNDWNVKVVLLIQIR
jgi:hypothetical protein